MPEQVRCPSCNAALRVPDNLLGKNVKCPKCQTTFIAEMEETEKPQRITREPAPSAARRRPRPPEELEEEEELPQEEELEEEEEERPRRRRRRGRRRAEAEAAVAGPAMALLVVGILGLLMGIANVVYAFLVNPVQNPSAAFTIGRHIGASVSFIWAITVIAGSMKMKGLQSYGSAMTACIFAMLPCNLCCLLGLPFGIWALVVLSKPEVKDAFR